MAYFLFNLTNINLINISEYKNQLTVPLYKNEEDPLLKFLDDNFEKSYSYSHSVLSTETVHDHKTFIFNQSQTQGYTDNSGTVSSDEYSVQSCDANSAFTFYNNVWTVLFPLSLQYSRQDNATKNPDEFVNYLLSFYKKDVYPVSTYISFRRIPVLSGVYAVTSRNSTVDIYDPSVDFVHYYTVNDVNFKTIYEKINTIDGCELVWIFADNKEDVTRFIKELKILIKCAYRQLIQEKYSNIYEKCSYLFSYEERTRYCSKCCAPYCRDRLLKKEDISDAVSGLAGFAYMPSIKHLAQIM